MPGKHLQFPLTVGPLTAVPTDSCLHWQLSPLTVVSTDSCPHWQLSDLTVVRSDSCPIWQLSDLTANIWQLSPNQLYSYGEPDLVARIHQNMPKIGCFWAFSHFFIFWGPFFGNLEPQSAFSFIKCGMKYPKWLIYATSIHKTELSNLTKKDIVLRPKHGAKFSELSWFSELLTFADPSRMKEIGIKMNKTCQCSQYRR